jgi:hypothetical protein
VGAKWVSSGLPPMEVGQDAGHEAGADGRCRRGPRG